jgi:ribose-phosphate pyrophosphokinase
MRGTLRIFSTRALEEYRGRVTRVLRDFPRYAQCRENADLDGEMTVSRFADGEMEVEISASVRGSDVFLLAGAARNDLQLSVEENKIELYHAVDALRRAQAARITVFEPYCSAGRSDRLTRRNSVGLWTHFKTLVALGIDHYLTFQLHSEKSKTFIDPARCAVDDIPAQTLLTAHLCDRYIGSRQRLRDAVKKDWLFCSVDAGGEALAKRFAASFGTRIIISHKQRDYSTANTVESINILASDPIEGKTVWIIDDMIDTGDSIYKLVRELARRKPAVINIAVVHAVLSPPAMQRLVELCEEKLIGTLLVTDTIPCPAEMQSRLPCIEVVRTARLAAEIVYRINSDLPLSPMLAPFNADDYLGEKSMRLPFIG